MHHFVFGINVKIHSVSLNILVLIHLLIHSSTHLSHPRSHHPSLLHSFTMAQIYLFNKSFPAETSFTYWTAFMTTGLDRTYHAYRCIFSFTFYFLFIPCGRLSWLPVSFLLHIKYTLSFCIRNCMMAAL